MALSEKTQSIHRDLAAVPRMTLKQIAEKHFVSTTYIHKVKRNMHACPGRLNDVELCQVMDPENLGFVSSLAQSKNQDFLTTLDQIITDVRTATWKPV